MGLEVQKKLKTLIMICGMALLYFGNAYFALAIYGITALVLIFFVYFKIRIKSLKIVGISVFLSFLALQIATTICLEEAVWTKLLGILMWNLSFLLARFTLLKEYQALWYSKGKEKKALKFSELLGIHIDKEKAQMNAKKLGNFCHGKVIYATVHDMVRSMAINYQIKEGLGEEYFSRARKSLDDERVFLVISDTGSPASNLISVFTNKTYNHISIAFDENLETIVSFNGGQNVTPPGLNMEIIEYFHQKDDASVLIYELPVTKEEKSHMLDIIEEIDKEGSAYNVFGMAGDLPIKPNIMYCSQFVYKILKDTGTDYFKPPQPVVKPTDFIEQDYARKLRFREKITF